MEDGYRERFKADYRHLRANRDKLRERLIYDCSSTLYGCPSDLLCRQVESMTTLIYILDARAKYEGIEL